MSPPLTLLVTGATGFVGRHLVPLLRARGHTVVAAGRAEHGEIGPDTEWAPLLDGVDGVIHLAARVHQMADRDPDPAAAFRRVNAGGTRRLAEQAAEAGVRRLVLVSSIKAMGEHTPPDRPLRAGDPPRPVDPYGASKLEAERALFAVAGRQRLEAVVLRPPLVYGPGVGGNFTSLMRLCDSALPLPLGGLANRRSLVHVANLAQALALAAEHPQAPGRVWLVRDGLDLSTPQLITALRRHLGRPPGLFSLPQGWLARAAGLAGQRPRLERLAGSLVVDDTPIRQRLGYAPTVSVEQGLAETVDAWRATWPTTRRAERENGR
ncbi:NAD-dependent epimerase/dehydratase family protein [Roseospirillum parvum]|uniref:Nucleoside-diphosphate-sugar epimerase n=1 Tax=Roseospirillum parvum TaxID=83401 RepID=A0A1G7W3T2_9PROT|nr:NAD-dependent epimerase/dehydratase family protein [Roseospirillum parvum]SDG66399.1 Nucleoside-diphosphate-sugar epimerase [Roseospirillum parvum]